MSNDTLHQWVNLPKDPRFDEDEVTGIERVGHLHFECGFTKGDKPCHFKVRLIPVFEEPYSDDEKDVNKRFRVLGAKGARVQHEKKSRHRAVDIHLPAAGGNFYKIEAKSRKTIKESGKTIETFRRLFYESIPMANVTEGSFVSQVEADFLGKYWIKLVEKGGGNSIAQRECLSDDNDDAFLKDVKNAYTIEDRKPFAFALVWAESSATAIQESTVLNLKANPNGEPHAAVPWEFDAVNHELKVTTVHYLWDGLDDPPAPSQPWLFGVFCIYEDATGALSQTQLPDQNVEIDLTAAPTGPKGGYKKLLIDLAGYGSRPGSALVGVALELKVAEGFSCGFAYDRINVIVVCRQSYWERKVYKPERQAQTLIHEVGHKIGMVPTGRGRSLDRPASQYTRKNHKGSHCSDGVKWSRRKREWSGQPECVMFGSDASDTGEMAPATFCPNCTGLVRRLDLGTGMRGFKRSVKNY